MKLTRRDAVAALAAAGVAVGAGSAVLQSTDDSNPNAETDTDGLPLDESDISTLVAAAAVLYPSDVENVEGFVTQYSRGRAQDRPAHGRGIADAVAYLDDYAQAWYDDSFAALEPSVRTEALRRMNADAADPVPGGTDGERVRYYVVNELLFALYASPTGAELVGLENPQGHPGGLDSYRRGPES